MKNIPEEAMSQEQFDEVLVLKKAEQQEQTDPAKTLMELADQFRDKRAEKASLEDQLKTVNRSLDEIEMKMIDIEAALEMESFTHNGKLFYQAVESHPRVIDEEGFLALLDEYGEAGIAKRSVHPQTLKAWYRDKGLEWSERLAGKLEVFEKIRIRMKNK